MDTEHTETLKYNRIKPYAMIPKRAVIALALCAALLLTLGCASAARDSNASVAYASEPAYDQAAPQMESAEGYAMAEESAGSTAAQAGQTGDFDVRKIVYTADMTITADDPEKALSDLLAKAQSLGGYVSGSYSTTDDYGSYYCTATL